MKGQVAAIGADRRQTVTIERNAPCIRCQCDTAGLLVKPRIDGVRTGGLPGPDARGGKGATDSESIAPVPKAEGPERRIARAGLIHRDGDVVIRIGVNNRTAESRIPSLPLRWFGGISVGMYRPKEERVR